MWNGWTTYRCNERAYQNNTLRNGVRSGSVLIDGTCLVMQMVEERVVIGKNGKMRHCEGKRKSGPP